jgi:CPA1 family monovalent cation:H+ antiporter
VRIQVWSFWQSFTFVLNGLVFLLIGLQLPWILSSIHGYSHTQMIIDGCLFSLVLIVLRLIWVFPGSWLANFVHCRLHHTKQKLPAAREVFVIGWTGMRGVVSLAAALALPEVLADGKPFPQRDFLVFLTFCVILVTLVLQGITLAPLVRLLGLEGSGEQDGEEQEARRIVLEAAVAYLETIKVERDEVSDEIFDDLIGHYRHKIASLSPAEADQEHVAHHYSFQEISRETTRVERDTAVRLRNEGRINDQVLRRIERELDLNETRFASEGND